MLIDVLESIRMEKERLELKLVGTEEGTLPRALSLRTLQWTTEEEQEVNVGMHSIWLGTASLFVLWRRVLSSMCQAC